jgi:ABC-type multidrug transport system ATPase subunit
MLRAALIGLPSSGKTTLFQLMTSIHDTPRGKGDVNIGSQRSQTNDSTR